ncbi:hypothetical protein FIBSPDRAFT_934586 [Athelia psychrophila]|uniref:Uncharacterized protein n=1 Tax=Athelia psychrophila TaxID=1759441 RepID=A0A166F949_9AGAM|nr:hypothetical protein FIBSPDRAFT_934586 [Fibularhizoctonia sp. CBS 109695]
MSLVNDMMRAFREGELAISKQHYLYDYVAGIDELRLLWCICQKNSGYQSKKKVDEPKRFAPRAACAPIEGVAPGAPSSHSVASVYVFGTTSLLELALRGSRGLLGTGTDISGVCTNGNVLQTRVFSFELKSKRRRSRGQKKRTTRLPCVCSCPTADLEHAQEFAFLGNRGIRTICLEQRRRLAVVAARALEC